MVDTAPQLPVEAAAPPAPSVGDSNPPPPAPADSVLAHYVRLFHSLLTGLQALPGAHSSDPPPGLNGIDGGKVETCQWSSLRGTLRAEHVSPLAWGRRTGKTHELEEQARGVLRRFVGLGAGELARGCLADEREGEGDEGAWGGVVEAVSWLSAVKSALEGQAEELAVEAPPLSLSNDLYPFSNSTDDSPMLHAPPPPTDLSFSFSTGPSSSSATSAEQPAAMFISPSELSAPPSSLSHMPMAPSDLVAHSGGFAPPPPAGGMPIQKKKKPASSSPLVATGSNGASSKAASFAARMSGLSSATPPAAFENITYTSTSNGASSSTSSSYAAAPPNGTVSPSTSFAPPPAAGQIPKPKKSRSSTGGAASRRTSLGVVKGKGISEVYHPPPAREGESARPQRKRKLPKNLTFEASSEVDDDDEGGEEDLRASKRGRGPAGAGQAKGKGRASAASSLPAPGEDDEEIDELASDYEEQVAARNGRSVSLAEAVEEESAVGDETRLPVGSAVMAKFPNYNFFPSVVLDPRTAPASTQGKRVKGAYLVKSIPSGADHRWLPPEETHIRPITPHELAQIDANKYDTPPPSSWVKWRPELVEAARLVRDPEGLKDWLSRPTDLEFAIAAEAERKRLAKATAAW
ncbi:hypothetical protein JCM6882_006534 [Rhodosporidiobolus microsporus]